MIVQVVLQMLHCIGGRQVLARNCNPNYHEIKDRNGKREVEILKCVVRFLVLDE